MKKEDFFEVLGELDDDIVKGAKTSMKKKMNWKVWSTMAASLCLIVAAAFVITNMHTSSSGDNLYMDAGDYSVDGNPSEYGQSTDLAPMVCVNHALYQIVGNQPDLSGKEDEFIYLGDIISKVSSSQKPTEDFQANDEIIGSKVYLYDEENVIVEINGQYSLYELLYNYE